jgi:magnesium chelatase subunit H
MRADASIHPSPAPVRVVIVTLDNHLSGAVERAQSHFDRAGDAIAIDFHAAADWDRDPARLAACISDIGRADIIIATMLFLDDHIRAVRPALEARREQCDAMLGLMSGAEIVKLTRLGSYRMDAPAKGPLALLKKLRGSSKPSVSSGAAQMKMLRRLPRILKFVPGTAQDVRAYFLTLQYWLAGSDGNVVNMIRALVDRYADGPRRARRGSLPAAAPAEFPDVGLYHPRLKGRIGSDAGRLPSPAKPTATVGVLILRSYILGSDSGHYDGVIDALEARGLRVIPAFAAGLDARPAIEAYFIKDGRPVIDALISLTGFSLVGGPAYNDAKAAEALLTSLDVPYIAAHPLEFQTLQAWGAARQGLLPLESTMMVAIPELDGATSPAVFGGRSDGSATACAGCERGCVFAAGLVRQMHACPERAEALAARVARLVALRSAPRAERRIAITLFNFPPNSGAAGTAAFLSVFESLWNTLSALKSAGYCVDLPVDVDALRDAVLNGNADRFGADANVHARIDADSIVRGETHLAEIEKQWGPAPGRLQSDGRHVHILGQRFGNIFVGLQPAFGIEGDPMRLLFDGGFAPTHAFAAYYRWLREDFGAHAHLHFGTHGALEFMPGKQTGLSARCWPERLLGTTPNFYLYAANNPSEGLIAKRRGQATLISHLTPAVAHAGLYRGLLDLKASIDRWRQAAPTERDGIVPIIEAQADAVDLPSASIESLATRVYELETTLIPHGLHVIGQGMDAPARTEMLIRMAAAHGEMVGREDIEALVSGQPASVPPALADANRLLAEDHELAAIVHALDGGFVPPSPGGDVLRTPDVLPTGRNLHGFDPFRIPSAFAVADGTRQADRLIARHLEGGDRFPETVAMVLWGTDNLKSEGAQLAQALALIGARPRFDGYGRLAGAELIPFAELGRPRIDVVVTLSGIFRDLLPLQTRMLAEAAWLASNADESPEQNFVRKHSLAHAERHGCDLETASLRVFSNAEGAYGANVNMMIDAGAWTDPDELADLFERHKGYAYGRNGAKPVRQAKLLESALAGVELAYQNLESVELGVTTIDQYVDALGGISRSVARARGSAPPVYIGDQTHGEGKVRTLAEQVALETRTRMLNPVWTEAMLRHGHEGVRHIEGHVTTTFGWSATTGQVDAWVYQRISETYVLDAEMRARLAALNPKASARVAGRLIEASERNFWTPDAATLAALHDASDALEDRLEGVAAE